MSKYCIGRYETGELKFMYFKRHKHFRRHKIRTLVWINKCNLADSRIFN